MSLKEDRYSRKNSGRGLSLEVFLIERTGRLVESHFIGGEVTLVTNEDDVVPDEAAAEELSK